MKLRVLAFALAILVFFIFVGSPFQQAANAIVGVDDALIAIMIAALAAVGITFVTTGAFDSLNEYVYDLFEEYANSQGTTAVGLLSGVSTGSNKLGKLLLNNRFVTLMDLFGAWLVSRYSLTNNSAYTLQSESSSVGEIVLYNIPFVITFTDATIYNYYVVEYQGTGNAWVSLVEVGKWRTVYARVISDTPGGSVRFYTYDSSNGNIINDRTESISETLGEYYWTQYDMRGVGGLPSGYHCYSEATWNSIMQNGTLNTGGVGISISTGTIALPSDDSEYSPGDGAILDVGASWGATYSDTVDIVIPGEFSGGLEGDATITYEGEAAVSEQVDDTATTSVSSNPSGYQVNGLQSVFPFCIPFDLYNFVDCLAADPVAPSFTWRFYVPGICDESIEIDLSEFESAAQILRTMELLLFCVGLAFVTRKIIRG